MRYLRTLSLLTLLLLAPAAPASDALRLEIGKLAKTILQAVGEGKTVKVGIFSFKSEGFPGVNSTPGVEQLLIQELQIARPGSVNLNAEFVITGDVLFAQETKESTRKVVKVRAQVVEASTGEPVANLQPVTVVIDDNKANGDILQPTGRLPPDGDKDTRRKEIEKQARNPSVFLHGDGNTRVSSAKDSPFAVEILVKPLKDHDKLEAKPRQAVEEKGQAFVKIDRGELYEVRVFNGSGKEVAVSLSIDGIDQFHFSKDRRKDGRPAFSHWILTDDGKGKPREVLTVPGWFHSKEGKDTFLSFLVVGYGQGAASKEGITARGQVGVIRVGIFECYPLKDGDSPKGGDETGFGPGVPGIVKPVRYGVGKELDSIAVRYTREQ